MAHTQPAGAEAIRLENITKTFPGVLANDNINFSVQQGEIHAICGENGAGKSVLMKTLYGMHSPDSGKIFVNGQEVSFHSPKDAIKNGIGMVHQHFMLADNLSVLENVILGSEPQQGGMINFKAAAKDISRLNETYGLNIDLNENIETLSIGERQKVEIIKALYRGAKILILDEPTAVLVPHEVEELFNNLREMKAQGETIIFIDHKLDEVLEISDRITVLRAGKTIDTVDKTETNAKDLAEMMVGSSLPTPDTTPGTLQETIALDVKSLYVKGDRDETAVSGASLEIHKGEIVGLAGVEGEGQIELIQTILGIRKPIEGQISMLTRKQDGPEDFQDITDMHISDRRTSGLGYIPSDRFRLGILTEAPLWENAMLGHQKQEPYSRNGFWLTRRNAIAKTQDIIKDFDVRTPGPDVPIHALSGGNQQKLCIGREMAMNPSVLLAAHPTRGIDVGAQAAVWDDLKQARSEGLAILLVSADLDELIGLSDRLLVIFGGQIVADMDPSSVTPRELGAHMTGAKSEMKG